MKAAGFLLILIVLGGGCMPASARYTKRLAETVDELAYEVAQEHPQNQRFQRVQAKTAKLAAEDPAVLDSSALGSLVSMIPGGWGTVAASVLALFGIASPGANTGKNKALHKRLQKIEGQGDSKGDGSK